MTWPAGWLAVRLARGRRHRASLGIVAASSTLVAATLMAVFAVPSVTSAKAETRAATAAGVTDHGTGLHVGGGDIEWRQNLEIEIFPLAAAHDEVVPPPGIPRVPRPGEAYVSSALAEMVENDPALAPLLPTVAGEIAPAGLESPAELRMYIGVRPDQLQDDDWGGQATWAFGAPPPYALETDLDSVLKLLAVVTLALFVLIPLLGIMLSGFMQAATRRADRLRTLAKLGVPSATARLASGLDGVIAAVVGASVGVLLLVAASRLVTGVPGVPTSWWPHDVSWPAWAAPVAIAGPLLVGLAAASFTSPARQATSFHHKRGRLWSLLFCLALAITLSTATIKVDTSAVTAVVAAAAVALTCLSLPSAAQVVVVQLARPGIHSPGPAQRIASARAIRGPAAARRTFAVLSTTAVLGAAVAPLVAQIAPSDPPPPLTDQRVMAEISSLPVGTDVSGWRSLPGVIAITAGKAGEGYPMRCDSVERAVGTNVDCTRDGVIPLANRPEDVDAIAVGSPEDIVATPKGVALAIVESYDAYWRLLAQIEGDYPLAFVGTYLGEGYGDDLAILQEWLRLGLGSLLIAAAIGTALGLAEDARARRPHIAGLVALGTPPALLRQAHRHELLLRAGATTVVTLIAVACTGFVAAQWSGTDPLPPAWWATIVGVLLCAAVLAVIVMPHLVPTSGELDQLSRD